MAGYILHTHTYIHIYILHSYIHTYVRTYVRTYTHTYINTYIYTYVHTYIHTYIPQTSQITISTTLGHSRRKDFTLEEIRNATESMGNKKVLGEDGITGKIYKSTFEIFPNYITAMYNEYLRRGVFPVRWKRAKQIPITKPGKEN